MINEIIINIINLKIFLLIIFIFIFSLFIDIIIGELPSKIHPVVIIGKIINFFTNYFIKLNNKFSGILLTLTTITISSVILLTILFLIKFNSILFIILSSFILSSTFSIKLLLSSANNIKIELNKDIELARSSVSYLVSRDMNKLNEDFIISATIESLTENIIDSYISPIFYYMVFGSIILYMSIYSNNNPYNLFLLLLLFPFIYRIINTLDAMVGYKNKKLINIGWFPAKIDDIFNFIPARIGGLIIVVSSFILNYNWKNSYKIMKRDARNCPSPNSGFSMGATAGALNIQLNKKEVYILGDNIQSININDIEKAINISKITIILFTILVFIIFFISFFIMVL